MRYDRLPEAAKPYIPAVQAACAETKLPEEVIWAQMTAESAFDPKAVSRKGAVGLMQLMPGTAHEVGVADPTDPASCIKGGALYLRRMLVRYAGRLTQALAAYNMGPGRLGIPALPPGHWPLETQQYVSKVAKYMAYYMGA